VQGIERPSPFATKRTLQSRHARLRSRRRARRAAHQRFDLALGNGSGER